ASIVYEDDGILGFLTIGPVTPGLLILIPKRHATCVSEIDERTGAQLFRVSLRMAAALRASGLQCEGVNWFLADGEAASQDVPHVHLHVFPRFGGDGFQLVAGRSVHPSREELDAIAARIREAFGALSGASASDQPR